MVLQEKHSAVALGNNSYLKLPVLVCWKQTCIVGRALVLALEGIFSLEELQFQPVTKNIFK